MKSAIALSDSIIRKLPAGNPFNILATAAMTDTIQRRIHPFIAATATVTKNIVAIGNVDFLTPLV